MHTNDEDEMNYRANRGKSSSVAVQEQRREDLNICQPELGDTSRMADEMESRLAGVRQTDEAFKA